MNRLETVASPIPANQPASPPGCQLTGDALEHLMPMHLMVDNDGRILRVGRTLRKLCPALMVAGDRLFDVMETRRPRAASDVASLLRAERGRLSLEFRDSAPCHFKAVIVPLADGSGALLNLSFGFSLVDCVRDYNLTAGDFAGTDLAVEMLYLVEAKSAALQESKKLNLRLQGAKVAAEEQAVTDKLTGLKNRRALDQALERLSCEGVPFGLLHLDLDYFKQVNDTHGHAAGDAVLQVVARRLLQDTRAEDTVARVGGDEFTLVFPELVDANRLKEISTRMIARLEVPIAHGEVMLEVSGSIGLTTSEITSARTADALLKEVDMALYASKRSGRGRATLLASMVDRSRSP